ncbi:hypothetical protein B0T17DRAFT_475815, partial [Bombardia bombarda]
RSARSKQAHTIVNKTIPAVLNSNARARKGIEAAELIVDPPPLRSSIDSHGAKAKHDAAPKLHHDRPNGPSSPSHVIPQEQPDSNTKHDQTPAKPIHITLTTTDTLLAARHLHTQSLTTTRKPGRLAILNMASPLRPGGGLLSGATSQEESLCRRTTLYPSLSDTFYRLPEIGGIYTPDVLVFHVDDDPNDEHLDKADGKKEWFFVDVVSAGALRFPDVEQIEDDEGRGGEKRYVEEKDREMVRRKMVAVMRILKAKGVDRVVLGAWGCGAYGNPVGEVARAWRRVLMPGRERGGRERGGREKRRDLETWEGMEVAFAVRDLGMARAFKKGFGEGLEV